METITKNRALNATKRPLSAWIVAITAAALPHFRRN
jgi:hypothetical protein